MLILIRLLPSYKMSSLDFSTLNGASVCNLTLCLTGWVGWLYIEPLSFILILNVMSSSWPRRTFRQRQTWLSVFLLYKHWCEKQWYELCSQKNIIINAHLCINLTFPVNSTLSFLLFAHIQLRVFRAFSFTKLQDKPVCCSSVLSVS